MSDTKVIIRAAGIEVALRTFHEIVCAANGCEFLGIAEDDSALRYSCPTADVQAVLGFNDALCETLKVWRETPE